jgi:hypothetical protein
MRHKKRSLAALNEHFWNEIWLKMDRLQPDFKKTARLLGRKVNKRYGFNAIEQ